ncbi:MAG: hypothetical protein MAG715_00929 [Methanonatronarchaeales archaeon]|nr:hypothetical protein [Methanonatronarchaeales archaeon]
MVDYDTHKKWATMLGVGDAAGYIDKAIDSRTLESMPQDFREHTEEDIDEAIRDFIIKMREIDFHDRAKSVTKEKNKNGVWVKGVKEPDVRWLLQNKTESHVMAYYLHFTLDYLNDVYNPNVLTSIVSSGKDISIEALLRRHRENRAAIVDETEQLYEDVEEFILENEEEIFSDILKDKDWA